MIYWLIYCALDGINDAYFYHFKNVNVSTKLNEHVIKAITRVLIAFILINDNYYTLILFGAVQPFIHNNAYYNFRHYLNKNVYSYSLRNQSETSTAITTKYFTPEVRMILFVISIFIYTIWKQ